MTEYCREYENLTIYHIGAHKCPLKPDTNKYNKQVRDAVLRNSGVGACGIQRAEVGGMEKSHVTFLHYHKV